MVVVDYGMTVSCQSDATNVTQAGFSSRRNWEVLMSLNKIPDKKSSEILHGVSVFIGGKKTISCCSSLKGDAIADKRYQAH